MGNNLFSFPVGYYHFHGKQLFNFQLNRWHSLGYLSYDDLKKVGEKIIKFDDWKLIMIKQADSKLNSGKYIEAAFFYRAAEFYTLYGQDDKELLYDKFIDLFRSYSYWF
jgi:cyanate lyase